MRRFLKIAVVLIAALFFVAPASDAAFRDMWAHVYSWNGDMNGDGTMELTRVSSGVTYKVLQADSDTAETLYEYGDQLYTSMTNPVTTTNFASATVSQKGAGTVSFKVDPGESSDVSVDLIVVDTAGGYTAFVEDFNENTHTIVIDERPGIVHHGAIWFAVTTSDETDTGIDFDYDTMIHDVRVETVTVDSGETLDVGLLSSGTNGDADGFIDLRSIATAGYTADTGIITGGSTIDYVPDSTYGDLLYTIIAGSDAVATVGGRTYLGHIVLSANEQSLTYSGSAGSDTGAGYIHYFFTRMR